MIEKFKDIPGYEGLYQVSNLGNVRSLDRYLKWSSHISINGKKKYLGQFETELEAHEAYQRKLKEIL